MAKSEARKKTTHSKRTSGSGGKKSAAARKEKRSPKTAAKASSSASRRVSAASAAKPRRVGVRKRNVSSALPTETRKNVPTMRSTPAPDQPPRLLGDTKSTTAALAQLEKAIKLIFWKDFRRARVEIKALMETHPAEKEILARARAYLQICDREVASQHKPAVTGDQLYTFGVVEHNRGNYDSAIAIFNQLLAKQPDADYLYYATAASFALKGDAAQALEHLHKAVSLNESNRVYAKNDPDFNSLHEHGEFADLVGMVLQAKDEAEEP
jgi:tetratricopeptide (TPR) repeat protein